MFALYVICWFVAVLFLIRWYRTGRDDWALIGTALVLASLAFWFGIEAVAQ